LIKESGQTSLRLVVVAFLSSVLSGCLLFNENSGVTGGGSGVGVHSTPPGAIVDPVIRAGHSIRIGVSGAGKKEVEDMPRDVSAKGEILMPLIGVVPCDGLSIQELQKKLEELYGQYIHEPQVSVSFIYAPEGGGLSPWGTVLVMGEVARKGPVNIPPTRDLTVLKAIQMAGGTTPVAALSKVYVTRKISETERKRIEINLTAIGRQGDTRQDIVLQPDDVVFVPETIM
jgi:protein involved in polysaccharide export with SLBB domain